MCGGTREALAIRRTPPQEGVAGRTRTRAIQPGIDMFQVGNPPLVTLAPPIPQTANRQDSAALPGPRVLHQKTNKQLSKNTPLCSSRPFLASRFGQKGPGTAEGCVLLKGDFVEQTLNRLAGLGQRTDSEHRRGKPFGQHGQTAREGCCF